MIVRAHAFLFDGKRRRNGVAMPLPIPIFAKTS